MTSIFNKPFTRQEAIPEAGIERAVEIMRSGKLHRYNTDEGETAESALLEQDFANYLGVPFCLACASGGYALHIALKAAGLKPGEKVLTNAFTLAPVPGAINNAGGVPVLVEIDSNYCVDLTHLQQLMEETDCRFFMVSHMRGHLADMEAIAELCSKHKVILIEDCAHTMGASWNGKKSGTFGDVSCFSTQTYKHINSGEGGLLTTNDEKIMARAIMHSGSYMLYQRHGTAPEEETFKDIRLDTPNYSGRMDNLRAAILRSQLPLLAENCLRWNELYDAAATALAATPGIDIPRRPAEETYVGSSIQFRPRDLTSPEQISSFISACAARGVELKWFGSEDPQGFTSRYDSWRYLGDAPVLQQTLDILSNTLDMRIPLTFHLQDMALVTSIIADELGKASTRKTA
ncbi:aminotransferase [Chromatiales bacterium (ex Bugula neritina AB1)]|nr:aminotransferase [Chromatiales bacterium (ex Bugula neritina AB1)]